jgi:hypothetical protein
VLKIPIEFNNRFGGNALNKIVSIFISFTLCLCLLGCKDKTTVQENSTNNNLILNKEEKSDSFISMEARSEIKKLVSLKVEAVEKKDLNRYMSTVNKEDKEYYAEQKHWFQDILVNDIKNYNLEVIDIEKKAEDIYLVNLKQQYSFQNKNYSLKYQAVYKTTKTGTLDSDLDFDTKETEHFIIKYTVTNKELSDKFAKAAEEAYEIVKYNYGKVPEDKTVIKIYEDMDTLKQFVKLSFQWDMAGWYEYSESIKFIGAGSEAHPEALAHELIHKVTIRETNNNMPYWLAEGLATHYSGNKIVAVSSRKKMNIGEMQSTNLEKLTNMIDIMSFYDSAQEAVEFIISTYGEEGIDQLVLELSKYPFEDKTGSEVDKKNIETFNIVAQKVFGKNTGELDLEFMKEK